MATHRASSTRTRRAATVGALAAASLALAPAAFAGDASGSHSGSHGGSDSPVVSTPETDCTPLLDVDADLSDTELADLELLCTNDGDDALIDLG